MVIFYEPSLKPGCKIKYVGYDPLEEKKQFIQSEVREHHFLNPKIDIFNEC